MVSRSLRFRALLALAVTTCGTFGAASASALEDEQPLTTGDARIGKPLPREHLRRLALAGRGTEVRTQIADRLALDVSVAERAALLELLAVADVWADRGCPPSIAIDPVPAPDDWPATLELARSELVRGAYVSSLARLEVLVAGAPDLVEASRAVELRALARQALGAHAAPESVTTRDVPSETPRSTTSWYGWQTLITDGAALLATPLVPAAGLGAYLTGAPIVHVVHGRFGAAAGSLGLRVGAPLAGAISGVAVWGLTSDCGFNGRELCGLGGVLFGGIGAGLGAVAAVAIDSAVLARETVAPVEQRPSVAFRPSAAPRREGGFDVGVVGTW